MLSGPALKLLRKGLLAYARRIDPDRMLERSRRGAAQVVAHTALHSSAYRQLLKEHGVELSTLGQGTELASMPVLTKANTFERFSLAELARPVSTRDLADVLTSSGRGGPSFGFRLTTRRRHEGSWFDIDLGLQDVFRVDEQPTLLVNCLPMGVVFRSRAVTVANVSVREDMACSILRDVGPRFAQTLLCTDPLFVRRLLAEGERQGIDWRALNTSVIVGEEVLVEAQRDYIAARMGMDPQGEPHRLVGSSFGVGELGLNLLFETRETIRMRRTLRAGHDAGPTPAMGSTDGAAPALFCYNPLRCHVEVLHPDADGYGELCFTLLDRQAVIPLPRYATGDLGRLLHREVVAALAAQAGTSAPWLPVVAVRGRIKDRPVGLPSVESVKELLYQDAQIADQLSGAFRIEAGPMGSAQVSFQAVDDATALDPQISDRLCAMAALAGLPLLVVNVVRASNFPWRPSLDYERKFSYVA